MGSGDAANLTAMLSSDQGHSSLASVMTSSTFSCTGPGDLFASSSCSFLASAQKLATPRSSNIPEPGSERASAQMLEWPYPRGEKWVVDALEEPRRATNFRSNMIAPQHLSNCPPQPGGLLRYHSAPSSFLQCLDDLINEDVFTEASSPLADSDGLLAWADNLTPIIEHGSQEMEIKRGDSNSRLNDSLQDAMEESSAQLFQMPSFMPPDESMSGTTSEENGSGSHTKTSAYSAVDCYLVKEPAAASAGLWNGPPSPGKLVGNRPMSGVGEMTNEAPAWPGGSFRSGSGGEVGPKMGGLVRHSSLPATSRPFSATQDLDDLFADSSTVPLKTLRAIRGHATHPRSIAERVRRGKISERMKKLQDLIPNMDQQTNTAEMLDEAVEYVKQLQMQVQELSKTVVELQKLQEMQGRLVP